VPDINHAKKWLAFAQNDYDVAIALEANHWPKFLEHICYHCQQSTEKALKAVLAYHEVDIPKTHNIARLIDECKKYDTSVQMDMKISKIMTDYSTITRYPDDADTELIDSDATLALKYAKLTLDMVRQSLNLSKEEIIQADEAAKESPK